MLKLIYKKWDCTNTIHIFNIKNEFMKLLNILKRYGHI